MNDLAYPLSSFTPAPCSSATPRASLGTPRVQINRNLAPVLIDDLPETVSARIRMLIVQGSDPDEPTKYASRSEVSWAVTCGLLRAGCDDNTVASILLDPDYAVSAHTLAQRRPHEYVERQILRAREEIEGGVSLTDFHAYMPMHSYIYTPTRELWPSSSVNSRVKPVPLLDRQGLPIVGANGEPKTIAANVWLDEHRAVEQMTWAPGLPLVIKDKLISDGGWIDWAGCNVFNHYRPPALVLGDAAMAAPWLDLLWKAYPEHARHIINWLAHRVQRPAEKINHALVMGGAQGIGKDTILEPVKAAVGPWNFVEVSPHHLLGRFNGFVKSVILRVSEARDLGDIDRFAFYDHTKIYTAAPPDVLRVDEKHLREYAVFNVCGVIITSNHKCDGLYLPEDDRRHYVAWSDLAKDDFEEGYWTKIWAWYRNGGTGHVAAYLAQHDLSDFDAKSPPPKTEVFWEIVASNVAPEAAELSDTLQLLNRPVVVTVAQVAERAEETFAVWLRDRRNARKVPHRFEECGYRRVQNPGAKSGRWKVNGSDVTFYARRELSTREAIEAIRRAIEDWREPY